MKTRKRTQAAFAQPESLVVAEEVGEDRDQDPDPDHEEEDLEGNEECFSDVDVGKGQGGVLSVVDRGGGQTPRSHLPQAMRCPCRVHP